MKKTLLKKFICLIMSLLMTLSIMPALVLADGGNVYNISDMFEVTSTFSVNGTLYDGTSVVKNGDNVAFQVIWTLPTASYSSADTFEYDFSAIQDVVTLTEFSERTYVNSDGLTCATYSVSDNKLTLHYTDEFLALNERYSSITLNGEVDIEANETTITGQRTFVLPGGQEVTVRVRTDQGLTLEKTANKRIAYNENDPSKDHILWVDYQITLTANADNTGISITDHFSMNIDAASQRISTTTPKATLNGQPYTLPANAVDSLYNVNQGSKDLVKLTGLSLSKDDVLVITYSARFTESAGDNDWDSYSNGILYNGVTVNSDQTSTLTGRTETVLKNCWIRKEGTNNNENDTIDWVISVARGEFSWLVVKDTPINNINCDDNTTVTIYKGPKQNSIAGAQVVGTTTYGTFKNGYRLDWEEGDNNYYILTYSSPRGTDKNFTNDAEIVAPSKVHRASKTIGTTTATVGTKEFVKAEFSKPFADSTDPDGHYTLNIQSLIDIKIGDDAVSLGENFHIIDEPRNQQSNAYHSFSATPIEKILRYDDTDEENPWKDITDQNVFTWSATKVSGQSSLKIEFVGTPVPGRYQFYINTVLSGYAGLGSANHTDVTNRFKWTTGVGTYSTEANSRKWVKTAYLTTASKSVVSITTDTDNPIMPGQILWKITTPSLSFSFANLYESYSANSEIVEYIPAKLKYESAYWKTNDGTISEVEIIDGPEKLDDDRTKITFKAKPNNNLYILTSYDGNYYELTATKSFKNTAKIVLKTSENSPGFTPARFGVNKLYATAELEPPKYIDKERGVYDKDSAPYLPYHVSLNADGYDMIPEEIPVQTYSVIDTMGSAIVIEPSTVLINGEPLSAYPDLTMTIQDGGHQFRIDGLEDGVSYTIDYNALVVLEAGQTLSNANAQNEITIPEITYNSSSTAGFKNPVAVIDQEDSFEGKTFGVRVFKVDDQDTPEAVPDAEFKLYDYGTGNAPAETGTFIKTLITDEYGYSEIADKLTYGHIYGISETGVPAGYKDPTNGAITYFVHKAADSTIDYAANIIDVTEYSTYMFNAVNNKVKSTSVQFTGTKSLEGRDMEAEEFSFTITEDKDADPYTETVKNDADGKITFKEIEYTAVGVYNYTIVEEAGDKGGVTYDDNEYEVTVTVTDDGEGNLVATISGDSTTGTDIDFENTYEAGTVKVQFSGEKSLEGRDMEAEEFSFTITEDKDQDPYTETVKNDADGKITFKEIEYTAVGVYNYTIAEEAGDKGGVTYDDNEYQVTVTVTDDGEGNLVATISGDSTDGTGIDFENTYEAAPVKVQFTGTKTLEGRDMEAEEFSFTITEDKDQDPYTETVKNDADGKITFKEIEYTAVGVYNYTIAEEAGDKGGVTYDDNEYQVTVTVTDDGEGNLVAAISGDSTDGTGIDFENTYEAAPVKVQFTGTKTLEGRDMEAEEFSFTITEDKDQDPYTETVKNDADGKITFKEIEYTAVGVYNYTIAEEAGDKGGVTYDDKEYQVTVTVTDDGEGNLVAAISGDSTDGTGIDFENTYEAAPVKVQFTGTKSLEGRDMEAEEFSFTITEDKDQDPYTETVKNDADGKITFKEIEYTAVGEYKYTIVEEAGDKGGVTYDDNEYEVTVTVTDDGEGNLVATISGDSTDGTGIDFENTYEAAPVKVQFTGTKSLEGRDMEAEEFSFTITEDKDQDPYTETVKNDADGKITFKEIEYTAVGEYKYTIVEEAGDKGGVTYDDNEYQVTVTVTDDGEGNLVAAISGDTTDGTGIDFENTYEAAPVKVQFTGTKTLEGRDLAASEFSFTITEDKDADPYTETVKNDADGKITFTEITYKEVGEHVYKIREEAVNEAGIVIDSKEYSVTVTVTDDLNGQLVAAISGDTTSGTDINFKNVYENGALKISKTVKGPDKSKTKEFTFTVTFNVEGKFKYEGSKEGTIASGEKILLKDGESITILGLPAGTKYTVTESDNDGYKVASTGETGTIVKDQTAEAKFVNEYIEKTKPTIDTSDKSRSGLYMMLMIVSGLTALMSMLTVRMRNKRR